MAQPKVSVVMSVYNGEKYLREAVESILNQTFRDFELIIVNDGSTDGTAEILRSYNDPRIVLAHNEQNIGLTKSLNKGLEMARGTYIARMDADDVSRLDRLERQVRFMEETRRVGLMGSWYAAIDEHGRQLYLDQPCTDNDRLQENLLKANCFCHGAVMFRRECVDRVGGYREEFRRAQDYDLWLRIAEHYEVWNIPEVLYDWRFRSDCISARYYKEQERCILLAQRCAQARRTSGDDAPILRAWKPEDRAGDAHLLEVRHRTSGLHYNWARGFLGRRQSRDARYHFQAAIRQYPLSLRAWGYWFITFLPLPLLEKARAIRHRGHSTGALADDA